MTTPTTQAVREMRHGDHSENHIYTNIHMAPRAPFRAMSYLSNLDPAERRVAVNLDARTTLLFACVADLELFARRLLDFAQAEREAERIGEAA